MGGKGGRLSQITFIDLRMGERVLLWCYETFSLIVGAGSGDFDVESRIQHSRLENQGDKNGYRKEMGRQRHISGIF